MNRSSYPTDKILNISGMTDKNGSKICGSTRSNLSTSKAAPLAQTSTENAEIQGNVRDCEYPTAANPTSQVHDNVKNARGKETACRCPGSPQPGYNSQLETNLRQPAETQCGKPNWFDCFSQSCQKESCFKELGFLPVQYPSPDKPCVPEYVHPRPPTDWSRRPRLPEPPEMLSTLKQGIRNPFQITQRRKEMQTRLDRLTDEHQAFAFPPGTRPFVDNVYYSTCPASSLVENYELVRRDIGMQQFLECAIRPSLLAFNRDKWKLFRERLPMPEKRILDIPGYRTTHWHSWIIRPLHTTYSESWRKDIKVPDNWFGPAASSHIC